MNNYIINNTFKFENSENKELGQFKFLKTAENLKEFKDIFMKHYPNWIYDSYKQVIFLGILDKYNMKINFKRFNILRKNEKIVKIQFKTKLFASSYIENKLVYMSGIVTIDYKQNKIIDDVCFVFDSNNIQLITIYNNLDDPDPIILNLFLDFFLFGLMIKNIYNNVPYYSNNPKYKISGLSESPLKNILEKQNMNNEMIRLMGIINVF